MLMSGLSMRRTTCGIDSESVERTLETRSTARGYRYMNPFEMPGNTERMSIRHPQAERTIATVLNFAQFPQEQAIPGLFCAFRRCALSAGGGSDAQAEDHPSSGERTEQHQ